MASETVRYTARMSDSAGDTGTRPADAGTPIGPEAVLGWVDDFLRAVGIAEPEKTADELGHRAISLGNTQGRIGILSSGREYWLRIEALIAQLPSDKELILPMYRELLELNFSLNTTCRLALEDANVVVCDTRRVEWLDADEVAGTIDATMRFAASAREQLAERYGGTTVPRHPVSQPS